MKNILIAIVLILVAVGLYFWATGRDAGKSEETRYTDPTLPIAFDYPPGYVVLEELPTEVNPNLIKTLVIMTKEDYESIERGEREGGEGPPVITLQVYRNPLALSVRQWVEQNAQLSNFPLLRGEVTETTVDGRVALAYEADGLYANRNVVFAEENLIYYLNGSYLDRESAIYRDFDAFLNSLKIED